MSASVRISRRTAQLALEILSRGDKVYPAQWPGAAHAVCDLEHALAPKRAVVARAKRTRAKRKTKREETAAIREAVFERAVAEGEVCECGCGAHLPENWEMDHALSRRIRQSSAVCWALTSACHKAKTNNRPSAAYWLERFASHAEYHGYVNAALIARTRLDAIGLMEQAAQAGKAVVP